MLISRFRKLQPTDQLEPHLKYLSGTNVRNNRLSLLIICGFLSAVGSLEGQTNQDLNKKKTQLEKSIQNTQKELQSTQTKKQATLKDFQSIQQKIKTRSQKIEAVRNELNFVAGLVDNKIKSVETLKGEISTLKREYAIIMKRAYKANLITNEWMLILSSESMNQAFYRWQYLKDIKRSRKEKALAIATKQVKLEKEMQDLILMKEGKAALLHTEQKESKMLEKDLNEKNTVLSNLSQNEKQLLTKLQKQRKEQKAITLEIERAIRREIEKKEREARKLEEAKRKEQLRIESAAKKNKEETAIAAVTTESKVETKAEVVKPAKMAAKKKVEVTETPESQHLSEQFQNNRGSLPWPVKRGAIIRGYGVQPHPELVHVTIVNNGIDIKTDNGAEALAVFGGEVVHIAFLAGYKNTVMVNHGKYYSIYSNLESINVSKGQKIAKGTAIGSVGKNADSGNSELHFELWSKQSPINPTSWLKAK